MVGLSLRPARLVVLTALSSLGYAAPAFAQVPVFRAPDEPAAAEASPPVVPAAAAPAAVASAPAAESRLPPAPPAPAATTPAPARAAVLTQPRAQAPGEDTSEDDEANELGPRRKWYGWQTLLADGASFALLLGGAAIDSSAQSSGDTGGTIATVGVLGYAFAPAVIHFVHRNPGRGFASIGLRIGLPIAAGIVGAATSSGCNGYLCETEGASIGALLGIGGAIAMDAALFAYDERRPMPAALGGISPTVVIGRNRAWLGVRGEL